MRETGDDCEISDFHIVGLGFYSVSRGSYKELK